MRMRMSAVAAAMTVLAAATHARPQNTLVATAPLQTSTEASSSSTADPNAKPIISQFLVRSDVQFRYARTRVESYVKNPASASQKVAFSLVMPEKAFVSNFSMLVGGEEFVAEVKEKAEAQEAFDQAVDSGRGAGLVQQDAREANVITVTVNLEPDAKVRFALTYEELLQRKLGRYEHVVHVNPGQIVEGAFRVEVYINESLPVESVRVPKLKTDPNSITSFDQNPLAVVERDPADPSRVKVTYEADRAAQKELSADGVNGQFIVQYDVDSQGEAGDVQVLDGYFVHFFSPDQLETLPKHVVFVLDVSGSMSGTKLDQTKDAMVTVLDDLNEQDRFNILTFSDEVYHWAPKAERDDETAPHSLTYRGTEEMRDEALTYALELRTIGGTNINDAMVAAIELVGSVRQAEELPPNTRPIIIFLTDGEATTGVTDPDFIVRNVGQANDDLEVPIYGLAFGQGADFSLIKKLSLANGAFARKIYEGSDAAIQLEDFYAQIASPLLADVEFEYVGERVGNGSVTKASFDSFSRGNEIVIAGKIDDNLMGDDDDGEVEILIKGNGRAGGFERRINICLRPRPMPMPMPMPMPAVAKDGEELNVVTTEEDEDDGTTTVATSNVLPPLPMPPPPFPFPDRCLPLPPPRPRDPRSEHENFVERLWAFMSIKEYLDQDKTDTQKRREELAGDDDDDDTATAGPPADSSTPMVLAAAFEEENGELVEVATEEPWVVSSVAPKEKTNREKAVDLAIKYNFVTPVTSLVVVRPDENATETVEPVPVSEAGSPFGGFGLRSKSSFSGYSRRGGAVPMMAAAPPPPPFSRFGGAGSSSPRRKMSSSPGLARLPPPPQRAPPVPQNFAAVAYDYDLAMDSDYESFYAGPPAAPATTRAPKTSCSGTLTLFARTYRRGPDLLDVASDVADLADLDFDDKLKSLSVSGDCCWKIFAGANHTGRSMVFREGDYDSPSKLAALVKKASSVQRLFEC